MVSGRIDCLIPAGGCSSRMNRWKPLLPFGESTIIETVVATALLVCDEALLVTGYRGDELAQVFEGNTRVRIVPNPDWKEGMLSSILAGVREVKADRFFLVPGDMPHIRAQVYRALLETAQADVVYPAFDGRRGHPVLIDAHIIGTILRLGREKGSMKEILHTLKYQVVPWKDDSILKDIDTPADYEGD